jgi:hypothetical protein
VPIPSLLGDEALRARRCVVENGAVHCIYHVRDNAIWRWTASDAGIRREILDCPAERARAAAREARKMLAATGDQTERVIAPELAGNLRFLADALLPREVIDEKVVHTHRLFIVTADGFLGCIPFEAFDVGREGAYAPLLDRIDVAYARYIGDPRSIGSGSPGIILVNTQAATDLRTACLFQPSLSEAMIEAETAASFDPGAIVLSSVSATKANLTNAWEHASYIYFATHTFGDPEVPYLVHIPLAPDSTRLGIDATYLDVSDIRSADLGCCRLVVLSGCSSGVPYIDTRVQGPSLGDAFIDAGAGAVVQTWWDVRDDLARELMTSFVALTNGRRSSPVHALCEARRRAMRNRGGVRHPSFWASYSIELGRFPVE